MDVLRFAYDQIGRYLMESDRMDAWIVGQVLLNEKGQRVSLRGPAKPTILVSEAGVWVQTKFLPPRDLPPHVSWGAEGVLEKAVRECRRIGRWAGFRMSNVSPMLDAPVNEPDNEMFVFLMDSGRAAIRWRPETARKIVDTALSCKWDKKIDAAGIMALIGYVAGERSLQLTYEQEKAARTIYNLALREMPEMIPMGTGRQGMRIYIDALLEDVCGKS